MYPDIRYLLITLLFIQTIRNTLECWWGIPPGEEGPDESGITNGTTTGYDKKDKNKDGNDPYDWGGFQSPPGVEDWKSWLERYNKSLLDRAKASGDYGLDKPADAGDDWPKDWKGLGLGIDGVPPPPWSYIPKNVGKADFCLRPPRKGNCKGANGVAELRWAFNPFIEDCVQFQYSGCYGNQNNFRTKLKCQQSCLKAQQEGCDPNSHIQVGDLRRSCGLSDQELFEKAGVEYYPNF